MRNTVISFICGLIFGLGLVISQMSNPAKVLNFLDFAGAWDPSLAFVMGGAVVVAAIGFWLAQSRKTPLLAESFHLPHRTDVDVSLVCGATLFGIGWGLVGFCPGPALTALAFGRREPVLFVAAMIVGMVIFDRLATLPQRAMRIGSPQST